MFGVSPRFFLPLGMNVAGCWVGWMLAGYCWGLIRFVGWSACECLVEV